MKINWNILGGRGGGVQKKKNLPWGEYGYFLWYWPIITQQSVSILCKFDHATFFRYYQFFCSVELPKLIATRTLRKFQTRSYFTSTPGFQQTIILRETFAKISHLYIFSFIGIRHQPKFNFETTLSLEFPVTWAGWGGGGGEMFSGTTQWQLSVMNWNIILCSLFIVNRPEITIGINIGYVVV